MTVFIVARSASSIAEQRGGVDAVASLERGELFAPGGQAFGLRGDLLGIDVVRLDPGAGVGLVVAGAFEGDLLGLHLDLESLAGTRLLGDRPEGLEGARLLFDLERGGVPQAGQGLARLLADETVQLGIQLLDLLDVRLFAGEQVLGGRHVVQARATRVASSRPPRA